MDTKDLRLNEEWKIDSNIWDVENKSSALIEKKDSGSASIEYSLNTTSDAIQPLRSPPLAIKYSTTTTTTTRTTTITNPTTTTKTTTTTTTTPTTTTTSPTTTLNPRTKEVSTRTPSDIRSDCPKDRKWIRYLNNCYMFSNDTADWFTAMFRCKALGAHLARIYTVSENQYIRHYATNRPDDGSHIVGYWIGGSDIRMENRWEWYETKQGIGPVFWHKAEQNNLNGEQDCLQIFKFNEFDWDDEVCLFKRQYVCKQSLSEPIN